MREQSNDKELRRIARTLGRDAAERIDPERVAKRVLTRLRTEPRVAAPNRWLRSRVFRVAAAAAFVVAAGLVVRNGPGAPASLGDVPGPYALEDLTDQELGEVLDSLVVDAPVHELGPVSLYDLNEAQLHELLADLEG